MKASQPAESATAALIGARSGNGRALLLRRYMVLCASLGIVLLAGLMSRHQSSSRLAKQASSPTIEKQPVTFAIHTFDPTAPPTDMPPLAPGEEAECDSNFVSNASVKGQPERIDGRHAVITVTEVRVMLQLKINIWVPEGATQHVIEHEQGHRQVSEYYYQMADKVAEQIAATYLGKQVSVTGADLNAEVNKLLRKIGADITTEYNQRLNPSIAQQRYDDVTDHSRNEESAGDAVARVLKYVQ
jgi:hypothetical protein